MNDAIKKLFFTIAKLNIPLHRSFIPTSENEADAPSRRLTTLDCKLRPDIWAKVQEKFAGLRGCTRDLKALDSDVMTDRDGSPLPQFSPHPSPQSCGVNVFAQDLSNDASFLDLPYNLSPWWVLFYVS